MTTSLTVSKSTPLPSLAKDAQYNTPTPQDVNQLLEETHSFLKSDDVNLYLIYFDCTDDFEEFLNNYQAKMIFNGLKGVVIQGTKSKITQIVEDTSYLSYENINQVYSTKTSEIPHSNPNEIGNNHYSIQTQFTADRIGVSALWDLGYRGEDVTIGIFDTGVNTSHADFYFVNGTSRVKGAESFINTQYGNEENKSHEPGEHGTGVAGFAAGGGIKSSSFIGMAPDSWILSADLDNSPSREMEFTALGEIAAINWAIENGVDIINRSYGPDPEEGYLAIKYDPHERMGLATIRQATKLGVLFVHSAGNAGSTGYTIDPTNYIHEISVGATDDAGILRAGYSSTGPVYGSNAVGPDVVAPGGSDGIATTAVDGEYFTTTGTSQSAPHVAGAAAVLLSALRDQNLDVNPGTIKAALMNSAYLPAEIEDPWSYGTGQINASAAYNLLINTQKIGNHPIVGATNPRNFSMFGSGTYPFPNVLVGTNSSNNHISFVSSESSNVSVSVSGNITTILSLSEQILADYSTGMKYQQEELVDGALSDYFSHDIIFNINVPEDTPIGVYTGEIVFNVNETTEILRKTFSVNVKQSEKKILFYTGNANYLRYNTLIEFKNFMFDLSEQAIAVNEIDTELTAEILSEYDMLWIAAGNRTFPDYSYQPYFDGLIPSIENTYFSKTEQDVVSQFVKSGGGVIFTPFSTPLGIESLINQWGISTSEIPDYMSSAPCKLWHSTQIGSTFDFVEPSGSYYSTKAPAIPLAYQNTRDKVVMASYDDPLGGRVVVMSGSKFITNDRYSSTTPEEIHNNWVVEEIINWVTNDVQLFGSYSLNDNNITFNLHASNKGVPNNTANIISSDINFVDGITKNITNEMPTSGNNGWYNFSYVLEEGGLNLFNFSWNSEYIAFEIITDTTIPKIGFSILENNSNIETDTDVLFWFYDLESGINKHEAIMELDGNRIGFAGPSDNETGIGYFIRKTLFPDNYGIGSHTLVLTVQDLAGNTASIKFVFTVNPIAETTESQKSSGFEWNLLIGLVILGLFISKKKNIKGW